MDQHKVLHGRSYNKQKSCEPAFSHPSFTLRLPSPRPTSVSFYLPPLIAFSLVCQAIREQDQELATILRERLEILESCRIQPTQDVRSYQKDLDDDEWYGRLPQINVGAGVVLRVSFVCMGMFVLYMIHESFLLCLCHIL